MGLRLRQNSAGFLLYLCIMGRDVMVLHSARNLTALLSKFKNGAAVFFAPRDMHVVLFTLCGSTRPKTNKVFSHKTDNGPWRPAGSTGLCMYSCRKQMFMLSRLLAGGDPNGSVHSVVGVHNNQKYVNLKPCLVELRSNDISRSAPLCGPATVCAK